MEELVRVNTKAEKKAYKQLVLGLAIAGLTIQDLKNIKQVIDENNTLKNENIRLTHELQEQGKDKDNKKDILNFLSKKEELK